MSEKLHKVIAELSSLLGDRITTSHGICQQHGADESRHPLMPPDCVCFPHSAEEVSQILQICYREEVPVIPFGAGTNVEGQVCAVQGGICIDVSQMNQITRVSPEDMDCTVQAGVTREQLNEHLRDTGLFFPVDPGANATLGGMVSTNASGTTTVRYGGMKVNTLALRVALPNGDLVTTAGRARKSSAGYDLTHLFIGAEGTLGIVTDITLRLHGTAEKIAAARVTFEDVAEAVDACILTMQMGIPVARIELLDENQIEAINAYCKLNYPVRPTLLLEFHGTENGVKEQAAAFNDIAAEFGGTDCAWTVNPQEIKEMWSARHKAAFAAKAARPGCVAIATDVCVPISRLAECIALTRADADKNWRWPFMIAGHVGDGNFHFVFLMDPESEKEVKSFYSIYERLIERAIEMGGTCTGEHGIGLGKRKYLEREFGSKGLQLMTTIKTSIDPKNIMNPGKIFLKI